MATYTYQYGKDQDGQTIAKAPNTLMSRGQCEAFCNGTPGCQGIVHYNTYNGTGDCWAIRGAPSPYNRATSEIGLKQVTQVASVASLQANAAQKYFGPQTGIDYPGNDIRTVATTDRNACAAQCDADANCKGFVTATDSQTCWLKSNFANPTPSNNRLANAKPGVSLPGLAAQRVAEVAAPQVDQAAAQRAQEAANAKAAADARAAQAAQDAATQKTAVAQAVAAQAAADAKRAADEKKAADAALANAIAVTLSLIHI